MKRLNTTNGSGFQSLCGLVVLFLVLGAWAPALRAQEQVPHRDRGDLVPLELKLPAPAPKGTPPPGVTFDPNVEPLSEKGRPLVFVPPGLKNVAKTAKLSSSDKAASPESLAKLVDGDKEATDSSVVLLRKGAQFVQLDFGAPQELFAAVVWHAFNSKKVYHAVVVQVATNAEFTAGLQTLFNNDQANSLGLGAGSEREYFESHEGRLIEARGLKARYMRFYSKGSTESPLNEYTEIEVYGRPAP